VFDNEYPVGFIGRTTKKLSGIRPSGEVVFLPAKSLVLVFGKGAKGGKDVHDTYSVASLDRLGRFDARPIQYTARHGTLVPEPGIIDWTRQDSAAALQQGWDVFYCDDFDHSPFELRTWDEDNRFKKDTDAWMHVWLSAIELNDPIAKKALTFLYYRSPSEYRRIRKHCSKPISHGSNHEDTA
jgi:hypothetical protein